MLSDRPYMRDESAGERTSFLIWLLSAIVAGFIIQNIAAVWLQRPGIIEVLGLSATAVRTGFLWTLLTYPLLHDHVLTLLLNVLGLFFLGRELQAELGDRRLAAVSALAVLIGGLAWFACHLRDASLVTGSTSLLLAYLTLFACLHPNREISFLVFFVIPVRTRPKYVAWIVLFIGVMGLAFSELPGGRWQTGIPHSAHLGGMLGAWIWFLAARARARGGVEIELPRWMRRRGPRIVHHLNPPAGPAAPASREQVRAEVDRILDKINSEGFGALTADEKRRLDAARDLLSRR